MPAYVNCPDYILHRIIHCMRPYHAYSNCQCTYYDQLQSFVLKSFFMLYIITNDIQNTEGPLLNWQVCMLTIILVSLNCFLHLVWSVINYGFLLLNSTPMHAQLWPHNLNVHSHDQWSMKHNADPIQSFSSDV